MYLKCKVSLAFCPLCLIISKTEFGAKYPAPQQSNVSVLFFRFIRTFRARINIQRVAVENCADVEVDLCLRLSYPLPILTSAGIFKHVLAICPNIKFHDKILNCSRGVTWVYL